MWTGQNTETTGQPDKPDKPDKPDIKGRFVRPFLSGLPTGQNRIFFVR